MCEGGRDLEAAEWFEYWDSRCLEACEAGRASADLLTGGEVTRGASGGALALALGFAEGEAAGEGDAAGDPSTGDTTVAMILV